MVKSSFVLTLNAASRSLLFDDAQSAIRLNIDGNSVSIKSGKNANAKDAIPVELPERGGVTAYVTGVESPALAKNLKKLGFTDDAPFFNVIKGAGGWYNIKHSPDTSKASPNIPMLKVALPGDDMDDVVKAGIKTRGRKPKAGSVPKAAGAKKVTKADVSKEDFFGFEARLKEMAERIVAHSTGERHPGRPPAAISEANAMFSRIDTIFQIFGGSNDAAIGALVIARDAISEAIGLLSAKGSMNFASIAENILAEGIGMISAETEEVISDILVVDDAPAASVEEQSSDAVTEEQAELAASETETLSKTEEPKSKSKRGKVVEETV